MTTARLPCASGLNHQRGDAPTLGVCRSCTVRLVAELRQMQNLEPADLAMVAAMFQDLGKPTLSGFIIGALPFSEADS